MVRPSRSNWCLSQQANYGADVVERDFSLDGGRVLAGHYLSGGTSSTLYSPNGKRLGLSVTYSHEFEYYGGELNYLQVNGSVALNRFVRLFTQLNAARFIFEGVDPNIDTERQVREQREGELTGINGQLLITPTPQLLIDGVTQYSSSRDRLIYQGRVRWRYLPGSDLFLVYRRDEALEEMEPASWQLTLKIAYRHDSLF